MCICDSFEILNHVSNSQTIPDTLLSEFILFSIKLLKFTKQTATKIADGLNENANSVTAGGAVDQQKW